MDGKTTQKELFDRLLVKMDHNKIKLAKEVSEVLSISSNVVYDRLSGKKLLNIHELALIKNHFNMSLDELASTQAATFDLNGYNNQPKTYKAYLMTILTDLRTIDQIGDCNITYIASETPFFYYLYSPAIAFFKMYVWGRTIWNMPELENQNFDLNQFGDDDTLALITEMLNIYERRTTKEFWTINMLDTTLNQINHCLYCGFMEKAHAMQLMELLEKMVDKMEEIAKTSKKSDKGESTIFANELVQSSTMVLIKTPYTNSVYLVYDAPNLMKTNIAHIYEYTEVYSSKIEKFSLSLKEEKQRIHFFKGLRGRLAAAKANLLENKA